MSTTKVTDSTAKRVDGRQSGDLREVRFHRQFTNSTPGSVEVTFGETRVLCTAMVTDGVPSFLQGKGRGWLTAEYSMLPSSTRQRKSRDRGKTDGRSIEIQRLIGRSLRAIIDFSLLGERTIYIDCDVLQADGGTRTASITGAYVALYDLLKSMSDKRKLRGWPLTTQLGSVSVGVVKGEAVVDLCYLEDRDADVDMNLVMTGKGEFVEIQGSAEGATFSRDLLNDMLALGEASIRRIFELQQASLEGTE
ncbi:MAG: ribonuclease PH [Planctomycetota bacterium]